MKAPYNPIDVANYIVWRANAMGNPVTHLKLQKLLYYVVAKYAKTHKQMLIDEPIVKWQYGPVVKSVYHYFKLYGHGAITKPIAYLTSTKMLQMQFANVDEKIDELHNNKVFKEAVDFTLDALIGKTPFELVELTHNESAWKDYEGEILKSRQQDLSYTLDELIMASI